MMDPLAAAAVPLTDPVALFKDRTGADEDRTDADEESVYRILDADGRPLSEAAIPDVSEETLIEMYLDLVTTRRFDERAVNRQRRGELSTYPPCAGQEGSAVGSTYALRASDYVSFQYREHGAVVARDGLSGYVPYWAGHESGNASLATENVFPLNISIGSHLPHAVGLAWAIDYEGEDHVVACHFGDGATSEGDFHEALTFAGVFDVPAIFLCHNNGWAISLPESRQTASATYAMKAEAYGFSGVRVDGMDPLACYAVVRAAAERARGSDGSDGSGGSNGSDGSDESDGSDALRPSLIEAVEYRFGAHTTSDDPSRYRDDEAVARWRSIDPIDRMETFLRETGRLDEEGVEAVATRADERVEEAMEYLAGVESDPADLFDHAYASLPPRVERQRADFLEGVWPDGNESTADRRG